MIISPEYQGMRWLKCDLHVHTPEDGKHWEDPSLRLSSHNEKDLQEKARVFLRRCYALSLDCIAVVDHNFSKESDSRRWFLTHLIEQNKTVAADKNRPPLIIFPGFELDIRYHLLCLFNPVKKGSELQLLSDILTNMGLSVDKRYTDGVYQKAQDHGQCWSLREVLDKVQNEHKGIVIAAHAFSNKGICNDPANIDDFRNNWDLYAVEVNKWPPGSKEKQILDGSDDKWRREKPDCRPAALMSSDCKSLEDESASNNLGFRFSWIKMSDPSIESLRQAFLDPVSRICLDPEPPKVNHTYIQRIEVNDTKFLQDQSLVLSPHLNCLIGGRGSGKSMLFESMRLGLRGEIPFKDVAEQDHVAARQVKRLRGIFTNTTAIRLHVFHNGLEDIFLIDNSGAPSKIENRTVSDASTVFRHLDTLIFSQEEITQLADRQENLLEFIDNLARDRLDPPRNRAREIIEDLKISRQTDEKIRRLDGDLTSLKQELEELRRQLDVKTTVQQELKNHRAAQEAKRYLENIVKRSKDTDNRLKEMAESLAIEPVPLGSRVETFPDSNYFKDVEEQIAAAYGELAKSLRVTAENFALSIATATTRNKNWVSVLQSIEKAEQDFYRACKEKGLTVEEAEKVRETEQQYRIKLAAYQSKEAEREQVKKERPDSKKLMQELTSCWLAETEIRKGLLNEIIESKTMPRTNSGVAIVRPTLRFSDDRESFLKGWGELSPLRSTKAGRRWDRYSQDGSAGNIGDMLFNAFLQSHEQQKAGSIPTEHEQDFLKNNEIPGNPIQFFEMNLENEQVFPKIIREHYDAILQVRKEKREQWDQLMLTRVPDAADLILLRNDGSEAGSFKHRTLSTGQKNTAVLSLLLARGTGPVLIDQPEDELDSEFLYKDLVPLFRLSKQQRQLIIVTHNANIPVNADAELVYALKVEGGKGLCLGCGGLDRAVVTEAVLDIMEGSEEAFRRRQAKYHF
ncbi:MAG: TrlF family AAA-like ATPase [Candidatus Hydrogenedentales bacterium]|jgi:energy-coupling factor transporter ATP-binding protein EcfA2